MFNTHIYIYIYVYITCFQHPCLGSADSLCRSWEFKASVYCESIKPLFIASVYCMSLKPLFIALQTMCVYIYIYIYIYM